MRTTPFFNAHHSPIGAFASFTVGCKGPLGGLGLELGGPANESIFVGMEHSETSGLFETLPFYGEFHDAEVNYDIEHAHAVRSNARIEPFGDEVISRTFCAATDTWRAGDLTFRIMSPTGSIPNPETGDDQLLKERLCPAVVVELTADNTGGAKDRRVFFGYEGSDRSSGMRILDCPSFRGVGQGLHTAIVTSDRMQPGIAWDPTQILEPEHELNLNFMLGSIGMLVGVVPAGKTKTFRFAVCFYRAGTATAGLATTYLYNRWFENIEAVADYALSHFDQIAKEAVNADVALAKDLSEDQAHMVAHAVRSYYGSTQLLEREDGRPLWIVNEGEYRMMNTCDLTADQVFFELRTNPWTVRNELEFFLDHYSYEDMVRFPGRTEEYLGGLAFTHDVGVSNCFSRPGYSSYEKAGLKGCFSYMSCEELTNWLLCACLYVERTSDRAWEREMIPTFEACLHSLCNRDHPDVSEWDGVMDLDSARCEGGAEITTYDSLDVSLGQARRNTYLVVKWWAAFVMMEIIFRRNGRVDLAALASSQASRSAKAVVEAADENGLLPAVLEEGTLARIIPVIEGLIFPLEAGILDAVLAGGAYDDLIGTLETHLRHVLRPGICKFESGAWKLSSTSNNSWLSKIYLCQHIAKELFHIVDPAADSAHWDWLMAPDNLYFAWSDQIVAGKAQGSRYYPRGVTNVLWTSYAPAEYNSALRSPASANR